MHKGRSGRGRRAGVQEPGGPEFHQVGLHASGGAPSSVPAPGPRGAGPGRPHGAGPRAGRGTALGSAAGGTPRWWHRPPSAGRRLCPRSTGAALCADCPGVGPPARRPIPRDPRPADESRRKLSAKSLDISRGDRGSRLTVRAAGWRAHAARASAHAPPPAAGRLPAATTRHRGDSRADSMSVRKASEYPSAACRLSNVSSTGRPVPTASANSTC